MKQPSPRPLPTGAPATAPDPLPGHVVAGRYRVVELVARGGMARVYRARDLRLDRDVALKVLSQPYAEQREHVERFLSEARTAASITHLNLVHVYDSGSDGELRYIAMELLQRHQPLREVLRQQGPLPAERAAAVAVEVLAGLTAIHDRGYVHCDVKSGNIMVGPGPAKLIDFGIARVPVDREPSASSIGSLHYMAPEQLIGERLTPTADLYSVGVVLYEAVTGRLPHPGETPQEVADSHARDRVTPPSVLRPGLPARFSAVVMQALSRDPSRRFGSAAAMARALDAAVSIEEQPDRPPPTSDRTEPMRVPAGAFPPPAAARPVTRVTPRVAPRLAAPGRRRGVPWGMLATLVAVAAVGGLIYIGLNSPGLTDPGADPPAAGASAAAGEELPAGKVRVPDVVGLSEDDAIAAAQGAGLNWTLHYEPGSPVGVYRQDPEPGTVVDVGADFDFYSYREP